MRLAPRTMLIFTTLYVGADLDSDEHYRELRDLTQQTGDLTSLAIATAGRIQSFVFNDLRVPEAATLASELEDMASRIDCDAATMSIILNAVAGARLANCEFDSALRAVDAMLALPDDVPAVELAPANAFRALIEVCLSDYERGREHLRGGTARARALPPVVNAQVQFLSSIIAALGMCNADDLVDDMRDAVRRAESFGDISGIIAAQWAYGTVLLRAENGYHDEAIDVLKRAHTSILKHNLLTLALASIGADLAIDAARNGQRDEAIDELVPRFRSKWLEVVESSSAVRARPW